MPASSTTSDPGGQLARKGLEDRITELAAHIAAANYELLLPVGRYDEARGWAQHGLASCAHWLQWRCGSNLGAARRFRGNVAPHDLRCVGAALA